MNPLWSHLVTRLTPYVPGEQRSGTDIVKLNTNENPYPPSQKVTEAIASVPADQLRRYPDPQSATLRQALAEYHHLTAEQVFVGNGSDEILALAFMAFFTGDKPLQYPKVSYSFYPVYCDLLDITPQTINHDEKFNLHTDQFGGDCAGIVFPNPNAPTGLALSLSQIKDLLERNRSKVVLIDEAYADFGAESAIELIDEFSNLVVSRTFSKGRSLAGMRLGAAFANADLIEGLRRVKDSFNSYPVDSIASAAGIASLNDETYYRETIEKIISTREHTTRELNALGYTVLPSSANFIFASPPDKDASKVFNKLNDQNILVRYWNKPDLNHWMRITIGTDTEMQRFFSVLGSS